MRRGAALILFALAGCAGEGVAYQCEDGRKPVARFGTERMTLDLDGKRASLVQVRAASGAKYADASTVFWVRANDAMLETPGNMTRCLRAGR